MIFLVLPSEEKKMKKILIVLIIIAFICIGLLLTPTGRLFATVTYMNMITTTEFSVSQDNDEVLLMNGEINSKTFKQLQNVIKENPQIKTIALVDVPGSLNDEVNFQMCRWIRDNNLNTYLYKDSHVASGGTDFFLAGKERYYEEGAKVGVHSWQDSTGTEAKDLPKDHEDHEMNRKYIEDMLGKDDFYWYTIYAAPAEDIYYMTLEEIENYQMYTERK